MKPKDAALKLLGVLDRDLTGVGARPGLIRVDEYRYGNQDDPYTPLNATDEYKQLAKRAITNIYDIIVPTPIRTMYVEGYRSSDPEDRSRKDYGPGDAEWNDWQRSRMDERQTPIMEAAWTYGHSFTLTLPDPGEGGKSKTIGLSPLRTSALFDDPANDIVPVWALTVVSRPNGKDKGYARMWDDTYAYDVFWTDASGENPRSVSVVQLRRHGCPENPVTRFAGMVDLEGRTFGCVERFMQLQDRLNQSVFDLLVVQAGGSFKVRWATGMAPPVEMEVVEGTDEYGNKTQVLQPKRDADGNYIRKKAQIGPGDMLIAEDGDTKFGTLDETPLAGYIESIDMTFRHISSLSQTPPHHLIGQIANLSADALRAAESAQTRLVEQLKHSFGESWERVIRLMASLRDDPISGSDHGGEVIWRDMEQKALSATADGLAKLKELGVPDRGLWSRIPGVTQTELGQWEDWAKEEQPGLQVSRGLEAAGEIISQAEPPADVSG